MSRSDPLWVHEMLELKNKRRSFGSVWAKKKGKNGVLTGNIRPKLRPLPKRKPLGKYKGTLPKNPNYLGSPIQGLPTRKRKKLPTKKKGGSSRIPGGRLKPKHKKHRSIPANQGRIPPVYRRGSNYKHGAHFLGGSLSKHDGQKIFHGAENSFYPAVDRSRIRDINYRGIKHAAYVSSVI